MRTSLAILLMLPMFASAAITTPDAQWDVNEQGRTGDTCFYEQINGTVETCSGTTGVDTSQAIDGIDFDGSTGYMRASLPVGVAATWPDSDFTIAARVQLDDADCSVPSFQSVFGGYIAANSNSRTNLVFDNTSGCEGLGSVVDQTAAADIFLDGETDTTAATDVVLVMRCDATDCDLWQDGVEVDVDATSRPTVGSIDRMTIGVRDNSSQSQFLDGTVYWAAIWETKISDAEVQELDDTENPFATSTTTWTDTTIDVGQDAAGTLSVAFSGNTTQCEFASGDTISVTANASTTAGDCATAKADFLSGGSLSNTRIASATTAFLRNVTETSTAGSITINSPDNGTTEHFGTSACANPGCDDDSLYENSDFLTEYAAFASGDDVWVTVQTGTCDFAATTGVFSCTTLPATGVVRVYDVTATDWLTEATWEVQAPSSGVYLTPLNSPIRSPLRSPLRAPIL